MYKAKERNGKQLKKYVEWKLQRKNWEKEENEKMKRKEKVIKKGEKDNRMERNKWQENETKKRMKKKKNGKKENEK